MSPGDLAEVDVDVDLERDQVGVKLEVADSAVSGTVLLEQEVDGVSRRAGQGGRGDRRGSRRGRG
jgi:hypothetical protein